MKEDEIKREGSDPFTELEKDTPSKSPLEDEPKEDVKEPEKEPENIPFHKDPRWIKREQEAEELRHINEQNAKEIAELRSLTEEASKSKEPVDIPDWFQKLYGENKEAWKSYAVREQQREQEIEQRVIQRQEDARLKANQELKYWEDYNDKEFKRLEAEGKTFDREELKKVLLEEAPTNLETGLLDFDKAYRIMSYIKEIETLKADTTSLAKSDARKQLADTATKSSRTEPKKKDYMTSNELRHRSWGALLD